MREELFISQCMSIRLPDGNLAQREVIQHAGAVGIVAFDNNHNLLLVRQYRIGADQELYEIPAGVLEPGEKPDASAIRELREEVGFQPNQLELLGGFYTAPGYTTEFIHLFLARDLHEAPLDQDKDEFIEIVPVTLTEALTMIERGDIVDGKTIIGILRTARKLDL